MSVHNTYEVLFPDRVRGALWWRDKHELATGKGDQDA